MATTVENFKVVVSVDGTAQLDRIADKANKAATSLQNMVLGIGFAAFIQNALQAADAISDLADATGMSIASIKGFEAALDAAGGKAKNAERILTGFYQAIETANDGSLRARDAFAKVGVTLDDLKNASEQDILSKTLDGLSKMAAGSERTATATTLLTKAFRGVDPAAFIDAVNSGDFTKVEESIRRGADAAQAMEKAYKNLQLGALEAISPILKIMGEHELTTESATKLVQALGIAIAVAFGLSAIKSVLEFANVMKQLNVINKVGIGLQVALQALQGPKGWAILAGAAAVTATAIYGLNKALDENIAKANAGAANDAAAKKQADALRAQASGGSTGSAGRTQAEDPRQRAAAESAKRISQTQADTALQTQITAIGIQEREAILAAGLNTMARLEASTAAEIARINAKREADIKKIRQDVNAQQYLSVAQKEKEIAAKVTEVNAQSQAEISKIKNKQAVETSDNQINQNKRIFEMLNNQREEDAKEWGDYYKEIAKGQKEAFAIVQTATDDNKRFRERFDLQQKLIGLSAIDAQYEQDAADLANKKVEQLKALNKLQQDLVLPHEDYLAREKEITAQYVLGTEELERQRKKRLEVQNDPRAGIKGVLKSMDEMTTPFKLAEESTQSLFNNMNKAIDNFVQTGKLKFGDFARSVILDLIAIQAKAAATQLLSFVLKDLFGFSLPGRAAGGPVSGGQAYIVGEQGPELFVPRASGTIVPNGQLGSGMGGGGAALATQVTYNINAVDAASFRQLVAREPEFLYAVTQKGRLSMPGGRR